MVSAKVLKDLSYLFNSSDRAIDMTRYDDELSDVVFDINTADSFVAGVASKILDREDLLPEEQAFIRKALFLRDGIWEDSDGKTYDLRAHGEIYSVALAVERLRKKCCEALD
jgi:hypothetical protein